VNTRHFAPGREMQPASPAGGVVENLTSEPSRS
jgi:hypothetical protein